MTLEALWVEKYRPKIIDDYVFPSDHIAKIIKEIVTSKNMPHMLLTGGPGTGKTTLALVLVDALLDDKVDFLKINASDENSIDVFRSRIKNFAQTWPIGNYKIVLLDEFDGASHQMQAALRQLMEENSNSCRFILTANYPSKIIPAVRSRSTHLHFPKPDIDDITIKAAAILDAERVEVSDINVLDTIVRAGYPDLRKVINLLQEYTVNGVLTSPTKDGGANSASWEGIMIEAIKEKNFNKVYEISVKNIALDEYDTLYTFMGNNISDPQGIIHVADYMFKAAFVSDQDLNFRALCIKLQKLV